MVLIRKLKSRAGHLKRRFFRNSAKFHITGTHNQISYEGSTLRGVTFDIKGSENTIIISKSLLNNVKFHIVGNNHRIEIGEYCQFNGGGSIWFEDDNCQLLIGKNSSFEDVHLAVTESNSSIVIGEGCMFAYDIDVRTSDSHSIISAESAQRLNPPKNVRIGDHVWVAAHCIILKGVEIAENSVVATGSIVTKSSTVPGVILAGNPAQAVKQGINWSRDRLPWS